MVPPAYPPRHGAGPAPGRRIGAARTGGGSALAAEEVHNDRARDERDRQARETEQSDEEQFEGDEIHAPTLLRPARRPVAPPGRRPLRWSLHLRACGAPFSNR
ncbi:hypothetical protein GCM10027064_09950 [Microbacterium petrolearium]